MITSLGEFEALGAGSRFRIPAVPGTFRKLVPDLDRELDGSNLWHHLETGDMGDSDELDEIMAEARGFVLDVLKGC